MPSKDTRVELVRLSVERLRQHVTSHLIRGQMLDLQHTCSHLRPTVVVSQCEMARTLIEVFRLGP